MFLVQHYSVGGFLVCSVVLFVVFVVGCLWVFLFGWAFFCFILFWFVFFVLLYFFFPGLGLPEHL